MVGLHSLLHGPSQTAAPPVPEDGVGSLGRGRSNPGSQLAGPSELPRPSPQMPGPVPLAPDRIHLPILPQVPSHPPDSQTRRQRSRRGWHRASEQQGRDSWGREGPAGDELTCHPVPQARGPSAIGSRLRRRPQGPRCHQTRLRPTRSVQGGGVKTECNGSQTCFGLQLGAPRQDSVLGSFLPSFLPSFCTGSHRWHPALRPTWGCSADSDLAPPLSAPLRCRMG